MDRDSVTLMSPQWTKRRETSVTNLLTNLIPMTLQDKIQHTTAIADAIQRREDYYTLETDKVRHIELPTPQIAGTMVQRRSYAMGKAMDILNTLSL